MFLSVVIPVYNRRNGLRLCLAALDKQSVKDFEVVVADDGSDDDPFGVLGEYNRALSLRYAWHQRRGTRIALTRNEGAAIAQGDAYLFLDSDVLLNPTAIGHYMNIHKANPDVIVAGRYDWLPPQIAAVYQVHYDWEKLIAGDLPRLETLEDEALGFQGADPRAVNPELFNSSVIHTDGYCLSLFSGNLLVPKRIFHELGRWDQNMIGHGGEDAEFGMRVQRVHLPVIFSEDVVGYHVWHERNQYLNEKELRINCSYIAQKHDLASLGIRHGKEFEPALVYREGVDHV